MKFSVLAVLGTGVAIGWLGYQTQWHQVDIDTNAEQTVPNVQAGNPAAVSGAVNSVAKGEKPTPAGPVRTALREVASQVLNNIYPDYSVPITRFQAKVYGHQRFEAVEIPLADGGGIVLELNQYQFTVGDTIEAVVGIGTQGSISNIAKVRLLPDSKPTETAIQSNLNRQGENLFIGRLKTDDITPGPYRLQAEITVDGQSLKPTTSITIEPDLGEIIGTQSPYIQNQDLVIPVELDVNQGGYYSLAATLVAQGQPVARMNQSRRLSGGSGVINLKVHQSIVGGRDLTGKARLTGLVIRRLPDVPGDRTQVQFGAEDGLDVSVPDTSGMPATPYRSAETERRRAFFNSLRQG